MKYFLLSIFFILGLMPQSFAQKSVFDHVMDSGKIRCGYNTEPPLLEIDPNTGKTHGAMVDIMNRIGELMQVDIEWTEQVPWSDMPAGLRANRYDMICNGKWILAAQTRGGQFSPPLYYTAVHAYGRQDETRIQSDLNNLNDPKFTITSIDGEVNYHIARNQFPNAKTLEMPGLTSSAELILSVLNKKADVTFQAAFIANDYMKKNPGKIKQLTKKPVVVFDTALMFKLGEHQMDGMLDALVRQMHSEGFINATLDKYNIDPTETLRVAKPYEVSQ